MSLVYGVAALARPTFDVPFAEEMKEKAFAAFDAAGIEAVGPRNLLFDADAAEAAAAEIAAREDLDALVLLQITFTDATMAVELGGRFNAPLAIWAVPEPRLGGRLRLNAFCGLNLAAHALGKAETPHNWLFAAPDAPDLADSLRALATPPKNKPSAAERIAAEPDPQSSEKLARALAALRGARFSVVGEHPAGFDTCEYDADELKRLADISVERIPINDLFARAKAVPADRAAAARESAAALEGIDAVDQEQLDRSFRLFCALEDVQKETNAQGLAIRCWPETFTEYGCAACGPMAMMNERRTPSACEADVYGSFSALMMQELADEPAWMADLVDVDVAGDTGVFWHCGLAPLSMCDPEATPEATIHTNRKMPLLHPVSLETRASSRSRGLSQARGRTKLVYGGGEFIRSPMAFTGTSGVFRFDRPMADVLQAIMDEALEHHYAIAYGDHRGGAARDRRRMLGVHALAIA